MPNSVYKVIELVGSSEKSWEEAAKNAVETASKTLKNLRVAEITKLDLKIENGQIAAYRAKVSLSFKFEHEA
jgi:flavin-binding protein dodecin